MSYVFKPMSEDELSIASIVKEGTYNFEVLRSTKKVSKSGNDMCELFIKFYDSDGVTHTIYDYLVFSQIPLNLRKVKHFCDTTGLCEQYSKGEIPDELSGLSGHAVIGIKKEQPNPNGGMYSAKNIVVDYVKKDSKDIIINNNELKKDLDDDIPF